MTKLEKLIASFGLLAVVAGFVISVAAICGWVLNLVALTSCDFQEPYKAEVIRGTGVVIPIVGAVAGYCTIEDGGVN